MLRFKFPCRFEGSARMKSGEWRFLGSKMKLDWGRSKAADGKAGEWQTRLENRGDALARQSQTPYCGTLDQPFARRKIPRRCGAPAL